MNVTELASDRRERYYAQRINAELDRFPDKDPADVEVLLTLLNAYDTLEHTVTRSLQQYGLSTSAFNLLVILRQEPAGCVMSVASELLLVSRANVTGLVDLLEARGLVERTTCENDRRSRMVRITPEGLALVETILPRHFQGLRRMFGNLSPLEKSDLSRLLRKLRDSILEREAP